MKKTHSIALSLCLLFFSYSTPADQNSVLLIESYHAEYPWVQSYRNGLKSTLINGVHIEFFEMDTKRLPFERHNQRAELAWNLYTQLNPKLVFLADDNALRLLAKRFAKSDTPVVYFGINNSPRNYPIVGVPNITGVLERPTIKNNIHVIKSLIGKNQALNILVLLDSGSTSTVVLEEVFKGQRQYEINSTSISLRLISTWEEWQSSVINAENEGFDAMVIGLYHTIHDNKGNHKDSEEIIRWSSKNASVPPFGFWDFAVGKNKTIGGIVLHGFTQGEAAATIANEILIGKTPSEIHPVTPQRGRFLFSKTQIEKWKLNKENRILERAEFVD